jgi:hypothetical protein
MNCKAWRIDSTNKVRRKVESFWRWNSPQRTRRAQRKRKRGGRFDAQVNKTHGLRSFSRKLRGFRMTSGFVLVGEKQVDEAG